MKLISLNINGESQLAYVDNDRATLLDRAAGWPKTMLQLVAQHGNPSKLPTLPAEATSIKFPFESKESNATLNAPIKAMEKVICIGANYEDHSREMGEQPPEIPVVFSKFASAITAPGADICLPKISHQVDFEAELVVVIGKSGRNISRDDARQHVFGYCCGNDISARDWQKGRPGGQWLLGKTFDTFAPIGPMIVTADEIADPQALEIELRLNGQTMQSSNTRNMVFPIDQLIAHLSGFVTLKPGDLIFTGTPAGVGAGRNPPLFLKPGDQLEVEIEGLGVLQNHVVADC